MKLTNDEINELALKIKCLLPSSTDATIDEISSKIVEASKRRRTKDTIFKEVYGFFKSKPVEYSGEADHPELDTDTNINEEFVKNLLGIYPDEILGYFNFRNNVILKYNRQLKKEGNL